RMFLNPVTQGNIQKLEGLGYKFVGPGKGRLASGRIGVGRMEEVDIVVQSIINELKDI
ncbi:MAG: bifunctional 4'-phosphopantothenoylcysteine decarboxylase/phosphopantothenoylcysteine synthetase, partial [Planctomycetes bacterium]|nr:bifunctional 4'-phosphopantothenoylcysteine decarboxylase/phosphopantothenoylcysteine synthetase [Planctomycetota bacterium]